MNVSAERIDVDGLRQFVFERASQQSFLELFRFRQIFDALGSDIATRAFLRDYLCLSLDFNVYLTEAPGNRIACQINRPLFEKRLQDFAGWACAHKELRNSVQFILDQLPDYCYTPQQTPSLKL